MTMLSIKEVATRACVSTRTVRRWRARGLRFTKHGRVLRFHIDDVDAFLRSNNSTSGGDVTPPSAT